MAASLLLALALAAPGDQTCLPGFKRFEDKCVTTVDTGFGRSGGTLNMMDCVATCGSLARPTLPKLAARSVSRDPLVGL